MKWLFAFQVSCFALFASALWAQETAGGAIEILWYSRNDYGDIELRRDGSFAARRNAGGDWVIVLSTGAATHCLDGGGRVPVSFSLNDGARIDERWPFEAQQAVMVSPPGSALVDGLHDGGRVWLTVDDGCGWPLLSEVAVEPGWLPR